MRRVLAACAAALALAVALGLGGGGDPAAAPATGTVEAEVKHGGPPLVDRVKVTRDADRCGAEAVVERVSVGPGRGLAHAVVSVAGLRGPAPARRPEMELKSCRFVPRVMTMMPGEVDFKNSDEILHALHTYSTANPAITRVQPRFKKVTTEELAKPEIVKVTCDVHPWMLGWIAVLPHPYAAVTDSGGLARLERVPAGRQRLEVWHETLGRVEKEVEVRAGQTVRVAIEMARR